MKRSGGISPRSGWRQRSSASTPVDRAVLQPHDRLVVQLELLGRRARAAGRCAAPGGRARPRASPARTAGSRPCRRAWRCTSRRRRRGSSRRRRSPDSCSATEMPRLQRSASSLCPATQRHGERLEDPLGGVGRLLAVARRPRAAPRTRRRRSARRCRRRGCSASSRRADLDQHLVAGGMPEAVVDRLEVVEVEEDHGEPAPLAAARGRSRGARARRRARGWPAR